MDVHVVDPVALEIQPPFAQRRAQGPDVLVGEVPDLLLELRDVPDALEPDALVDDLDVPRRPHPG